jgi:phage terminase small subunit
MAGKTKKPTVKQQKFVEGVVRHGNATKAARDAGYKYPNKQGHQNLVKLGISEAVEKRKAEALKRAGITTDEIVGSIAEIALSSLADVNPEDEFLRKAKEIGVDHLIKKVKVNVDNRGMLRHENMRCIPDLMLWISC